MKETATYPDQYEVSCHFKEGSLIHFRPIRPDAAALLLEFIRIQSKPSWQRLPIAKISNGCDTGCHFQNNLQAAPKHRPCLRRQRWAVQLEGNMSEEPKVQIGKDLLSFPAGYAQCARKEDDLQYQQAIY